jgi:hypothetical protein
LHDASNGPARSQGGGDPHEEEVGLCEGLPRGRGGHWCCHLRGRDARKCLDTIRSQGKVRREPPRIFSIDSIPDLAWLLYHHVVRLCTRITPKSTFECFEVLSLGHAFDSPPIGSRITINTMMLPHYASLHAAPPPSFRTSLDLQSWPGPPLIFNLGSRFPPISRRVMMKTIERNHE